MARHGFTCFLDALRIEVELQARKPRGAYRTYKTAPAAAELQYA